MFTTPASSRSAGKPCLRGPDGHVARSLCNRPDLTAFEDFVAGKYSESGSAGCLYFDSDSHANDDKKQNEDLVTKNGGRFTETGWRYQGPP